MSKEAIYHALRDGGLSPSGACAMMGNMWAESGLRSNNVQDNCPMNDSDYTYNVEHGITSKWQFETDSYGYGLCQWTASSRKDALYIFAKAKGVPISDETMQCEFCIKELREDFNGLYQYLCTTEDTPKATERICAEFECPAVNNFAVRINAALGYYREFGETECTGDSCSIEIPTDEICSVNVRVLHKGSLGRDVYLLQCGLNDAGYTCGKADGDFGRNTENAVIKLQNAKGINPVNGIANAAVWAEILKVR